LAKNYAVLHGVLNVLIECDIIVVVIQGLLFVPCFSEYGGALLVMNPLTAKSCLVNKFMFPSSKLTRYLDFCLLSML